jgi:hypothetical protein
MAAHLAVSDSVPLASHERDPVSSNPASHTGAQLDPAFKSRPHPAGSPFAIAPDASHVTPPPHASASAAVTAVAP